MSAAAVATTSVDLVSSRTRAIAASTSVRPTPPALVGGLDGHVLELRLARSACLGELEVAEDLLAVDRDQDPPGVDVGVELTSRVFRELEQGSKNRPRAHVLVDTHRAPSLKPVLEDPPKIAEPDGGEDPLGDLRRLQAGRAASAGGRVVCEQGGHRGADPASSCALERPDV